MITVEDLLRPSPELRSLAQPDMDPLTEDDALQEAQLLDIRVDALRLTVGLLFDLRSALQLRDANTGILVAHVVRELTWSAGSRDTDLTSWTVGGSVTQHDGLFGLKLGLWPSPGAHLSLVAERAQFVAGDIPGLPETPPNYGDDDDRTIRAGLAHWAAQFSPTHAIFVDPAS